MGTLNSSTAIRSSPASGTKAVRVLIATDVAGRGLDVEGLDLVINYDLPMQKEGYIHRIGRTGRAGANGVAVTLVEDKNDQNLSAIQAFTGQKIATLDLHAGRKARPR